VSDGVLGTTNQKARKRHRCLLCCENIEVGEVYKRRAIISYGRLYDIKSHVVCLAFLDATYDETDCECFSPGDIDRKQAEEWAKQKESAQ